MVSGVDSNKNVYPIRVDSSGRPYVLLTDGAETANVDTSNRLEVSVLNLKPDGSNTLSSLSSPPGAGFVKITNGTHTALFDIDDDDIANGQRTLLIINQNYVYDSDNSKWVRETPAAAAFAMLDFWSLPTTVSFTTTPADKTLSNVVIPDLSGLSIQAAYAMISISSLVESAGTNARNLLTTYVQVDKAAAGYTNAIQILEDFITLPLNSRVSKYTQAIGSYDISARVANNATTNFKWANVDSTSTDFQAKGVRTGIRLIIEGA